MELTKDYEVVLKYYTTHTNEQIGEMIKKPTRSIGAMKAHLTRQGYTHSILALKKDKKVVKSVKTTTQFNKINEGKTKARFYIHNGILLSNIHDGKIISLPCNNWFIEKSILEDFPSNFRILGVEMDKNIYKSALIELVKTPILVDNCSLLNGKVSEMIYKGSEDEYSHLILDYCGGFGKFENEVKYAMMNKIVKVGGTISLTFSVRALGEAGRLILKRFGIGDTKNKNKFAMKYLVDSVNTVCGANYSIETDFTYKDSEPMILFILKRNK